MRVWLVALFLVAFNISLTMLDSTHLNVWYSTYPERYDFSTHSWYTPDEINGSYYGSNTTVLKQAKELKTETPGIGESLLTGIVTAIFGDAGGGVTSGLMAFWHVITGIFTSTGQLLSDMGFPDYFSGGVQTLINLVIMYGGLQFFLGRSGKTIE